MAKKTFEQAMKALEQIVQELESGDMPLETAIKKFEEGIQLSKFCTEKLDESEKRVTILMKDTAGQITELPFTDPHNHHNNNSDAGKAE
jgi:exodeoxyribonuclease VII small subunit